MPFLIRSQTDSGGGVALQVQWQVGEPVTMAKLVNLAAMRHRAGAAIACANAAGGITGREDQGRNAGGLSA